MTLVLYNVTWWQGTTILIKFSTLPKRYFLKKILAFSLLTLKFLRIVYPSDFNIQNWVKQQSTLKHRMSV